MLVFNEGESRVGLAPVQSALFFMASDALCIQPSHGQVPAWFLYVYSPKYFCVGDFGIGIFCHHMFWLLSTNAMYMCLLLYDYLPFYPFLRYRIEPTYQSLNYLLG